MRSAFASLAFLSLFGCQTLEKGIPGMTRYLQFVDDGVVVWEHSVGMGSASCEVNATNNNRELEQTKESDGRYRCATEPAPESVLPYFYVSSFERVVPGGLAYNAPTMTRFPTPNSCWASLGRLKDNERVLKRESCGPKPAPRIRPGEKTA